MNSKHGRKSMDAITITLILTPEELQGMLRDLQAMKNRANSSWDVETLALINALTQASVPVTHRKSA